MSGGVTRQFDFGSLGGAHFYIDVVDGWVRGVLCNNPSVVPVHAEATFDAPIGVVGQDFPPNAPGVPTVIDIPAGQVACVLDAENEPVFTPALTGFAAWSL
jgi:hypothetical protein